MENLKLKILPYDLTVCTLPALEGVRLDDNGFFFLARTDNELSLVCETSRVPLCVLEREDGWNIVSPYVAKADERKVAAVDAGDPNKSLARLRELIGCEIV